MNIGDHAAAKLQAQQYWSPSGIGLVVGETYAFCAHGTWTDFFISSTAMGIVLRGGCGRYCPLYSRYAVPP